MSWEHVLLNVTDNIALITLNRPERMNAFGGMMRQEIVEVLERVAVDKDVRVVVITGAGKAFCTGGDVGEFGAGTTKALAPAVSSERHAMCKAVLSINRMEKPVIAAVMVLRLEAVVIWLLPAISGWRVIRPDSAKFSLKEECIRTGVGFIFYRGLWDIPKLVNLYFLRKLLMQLRHFASVWLIKCFRMKSLKVR